MTVFFMCLRAKLKSAYRSSVGSGLWMCPLNQKSKLRLYLCERNINSAISSEKEKKLSAIQRTCSSSECVLPSHIRASVRTELFQSFRTCFFKHQDQTGSSYTATIHSATFTLGLERLGQNKQQPLKL